MPQKKVAANIRVVFRFRQKIWHSQDIHHYKPALVQFFVGKATLVQVRSKKISPLLKTGHQRIKAEN
jgi:hypothetical protein